MNQLSEMVEVFKTNISKEDVASMLVRSLSIQFPEYKINIDFEDCDKVLRIESLHGDLAQIDLEQMKKIAKSRNVTIELLT